MPTVTEAIERGRRDIIAHESRIAAMLVDEYARASRAIDRELQRITINIAEAVARGELASDAWLNQQQWYWQLQGTIDAEMVRFQETAYRTVASAQVTSVGIAGQTATMFSAAINTTFAGRVNAPAFERWVSAMQPGSPIRQVIDGYGVRASEAIRNGITEGIGTGKGSRAITRGIMQKVGPDAVEGRMSTLTRSEVMRAYRGAFADTMEPFREQGIVTGYTWLCALSSRTCLACWAKHGTFSKDYPVGFHPACRCIGRPAVNPSLVPSEGRPRMTGEELLRRRPEDVQRRILQSPERYDLWANGVPVTDMVGIRRNRVWGDNVRIKSMKELQP